MQALQKTEAAKGLSLNEVRKPRPGSGEVLVRVHSTGVCGTDLHIDAWTASYHFITPSLPVTIGHEFSGVIEAHGPDLPADALSVGQLVAVRPSVTCGRCDACLRGDFDACATRRGIGVARDGGFAEYVAVPLRNCVPIPQDVDPEIAALAEPLTVSYEAVRTGGVQAGASRCSRARLARPRWWWPAMAMRRACRCCAPWVSTMCWTCRAGIWTRPWPLMWARRRSTW